MRLIRRKFFLMCTPLVHEKKNLQVVSHRAKALLEGFNQRPRQHIPPVN